MKFIQPLEIASKIMTLIEESESELIIVSPYVEVSKWNKMKSCLKRAVSRGVDIHFIARKNAKQDLSFVTELGIKIKLVENLHAKVYLNDNYGIVTSQNITYYSDINSIDIGYMTSCSDERIELIGFIEKYVYSFTNKTQVLNQNTSLPNLNKEEVDIMLDSFSNKYPSAYFSKSNTYIYCEKVLPYVIMLSSDLTIRLSKKNDRYLTIINQCGKVKFPLMKDYKLELKEAANYYYINFIPKKPNGYDVTKLTSDYFEIINTFRKNLSI